MVSTLLVVSGFIIMFLIGIRVGRKTANENSYWNGHNKGWKACEDIVVKRMIEAGYNKEKIWKELIQ